MCKRESEQKIKEREKERMRIYFEIEDCQNEELLAAAKNIRTIEDMEELHKEGYEWDSIVDAFAATHSTFDEYRIKELLYEFFYDELLPDYIEKLNRQVCGFDNTSRDCIKE